MNSILPSISIVMPVYNAQAYLDESINSILNQSFTDFELIVIDDGSTDNSVEIIESYQDNRIVLLKNKHDYIHSLNSGMTAAKGKYIARMDADDIMLPHRLKTIYEFLEAHPDIDLCGGWEERFGIQECILRHPVAHEEIVLTMLFHCPFCHPTVMMRRGIVDNMPLHNGVRQCYNPDYIYAEDYKLWVDLAIKGCRFANVPSIVIKYRMSVNQTTGRFLNEMLTKSLTIRGEYMEFYMGKLIEKDESLYGILNEAIILRNNEIITPTQLAHILHILSQNQKNQH